MTSTEIEILKIIWKNKGRAPTAKIAQELKISNDYSRLICRNLIKDKLVEFFEKEYRITNLGKEKLERHGIIEKIPKENEFPLGQAPKESKHPSGQVKKAVKPQKLEKPREKPITRKERKTSIAELSNLTPKLTEALKHKGFKTLEDIATASVSKIMEAIGGMGFKKTADIINEAREQLKKKGKEYLWTP